MRKVKVKFVEKKKFAVKVRGHEFFTDLPERLEGDDTAPTPTELFISSLGACVGLYAVRYLQTAKLNPEGLIVDLDWDFHKEKSSVGEVKMTIKAPKADVGKRDKALIAAAKKCTIHNTLKNCPEMEIKLDGE